jgi:AcrR family transcriptional regulator
MEKAERRAQILARAREVFAKHGYHAATVDDIALAAGVARGTFYLYFEDKRAVFADLVDRFLARIHLTIQRIAVDDPGHTVAEQVRDNIYRVISLFLNDRAMAKILLTDALGLDANFDRKLGAIYEEIFSLLSESLREGQQLGIVADGDTLVMAWLSVGAIKELLFQAAVGSGGEIHAERLTDHIFNFLNGGYLRIPANNRLPDS